MVPKARDQKNEDCRSPTGALGLRNPLDFIQEDHLREREICAALDRLAEAQKPDPNEASRILAYLLTELPAHLEDEELDLFPLLRRRCKPDEEIGKAIERLLSDHRHTNAGTQEIVAILRSLEAEDGVLTKDNKSALIAYAAHARGHLNLENAIILPFARLRLTNSDLETLCLRMKQRRGQNGVMEGSHAE